MLRWCSQCHLLQRLSFLFWMLQPVLLVISRCFDGLLFLQRSSEHKKKWMRNCSSRFSVLSPTHRKFWHSMRWYPIQVVLYGYMWVETFGFSNILTDWWAYLKNWLTKMALSHIIRFCILVYTLYKIWLLILL